MVSGLNSKEDDENLQTSEMPESTIYILHVLLAVMTFIKMMLIICSIWWPYICKSYFYVQIVSHLVEFTISSKMNQASSVHLLPYHVSLYSFLLLYCVMLSYHLWKSVIFLLIAVAYTNFVIDWFVNESEEPVKTHISIFLVQVLFLTLN